MPAPPRRRPSLLALLLLLPVLAACDTGMPEEEERVGVSGRWTGELTYVDPNDPSDVQVFAVDLTLQDVVSTITGSGFVDLPSGRLSFTVPFGLYDSRLQSLSLTLIFDQPPQGTLSGIVSPERDRIDGTMGGPGLVNGEVELTLSLQRAP